jgi:hypothetical protein
MFFVSKENSHADVILVSSDCYQRNVREIDRYVATSIRSHRLDRNTRVSRSNRQLNRNAGTRVVGLFDYHRKEKPS